MKSIIYISTSAIKPDPRNPRRTFNDAELDTIPAVVRKLSYDEAIDFAITETYNAKEAK
ncbi:MAG: hypothetical protein SNH27_07465 [Rikenellaceae bacterium]